jgi:DNA polymerase-3 subunit epsilon
MEVLGIDVETTGLDFATDRITEISAVLWDTERKIPLKFYSTLVKEDDRPKINDSEVVTIITDEMIEKYGVRPTTVLAPLTFLFQKVDVIVAHNGNKFDRPMLEMFYKGYDCTFPTNVWIDTMTDIKYPQHCISRNLLYLAAFHGFVNPFPHRSLFDVVTMLKVLSFYDIQDILDRAQSPIVSLKAAVSYEDKDLAKAAGFKWDPDLKIWYMELKECDITEEWKRNLPFKVIQM